MTDFPSSLVTETLKLAHAALLRIRTASIAGCEEGYGKPEKWADELFTSHGDVTKAIKAIEEILSSGHAQKPSKADLEKAEMCERLSFPPEDARHITVDKLLREYAAILRSFSTAQSSTNPRNSNLPPRWRNG